MCRERGVPQFAKRNACGVAMAFEGECVDSEPQRRCSGPVGALATSCALLYQQLLQSQRHPRVSPLALDEVNSQEVVLPQVRDELLSTPHCN